MRGRGTFSQMMIVFTAIILVCTSLLMAVFFVTMRDAQTAGRMAALKSQAYDIAEIFGSMQERRSIGVLGRTDFALTQDLLSRKLRILYDEYSAYCLMVDSSGKGVAYFLSLLEEHKDLQTNFDAQSITSTLQAVLGGKELVTQTNSPNGPMFTVAVPWVQQGSVQGAIYIQTAAQTVRASYEVLFFRVTGVAALAVLITAFIAALYTRRLTNPLRQMANAARAFSSGDFAHQVPEKGNREMVDLAAAFNFMSTQLQDTEQKRRDFIANLSHELRSPMTSITGFIQGVLDETIPKEQTQHYLELSLAESHRLNKLINSLLHLSNMESDTFALHRTQFDVNELIRRVVITSINGIESKALDVDLHFQEDTCLVFADRDQIEQVLINLMENAIKFTPTHGRIQFTTSVLDAKQAQIMIRDNGIGILLEDQPHVFDRFYKADKAHSVGKGTGLGLSISRMILERHSQQIRLIPTEEGACFQFTLPRTEGKQERLT